jgi:hypothetical protein
MVNVHFSRPTALIAVGQAQDPNRIARRGGECHQPGGAVTLVVGVREYRE